MSIVPSPPAVRVLLALSDSLGDRPGWVMVGAVEGSSGATMGEAEVSAALADLVDRGYCVHSAHGGLVYLTHSGAALARAARAAIRSGVSISEITLDCLAKHLLPRPLRE